MISDEVKAVLSRMLNVNLDRDGWIILVRDGYISIDRIVPLIESWIRLSIVAEQVLYRSAVLEDLQEVLDHHGYQGRQI